jgi:5-methylcytosine-specific restriction endonuclease McrA
MTLKTCNGCGLEKEETVEFFNMLPSGYFRGKCKECMAANTKRHYEKDPGKVMARVARYKDQMRDAGGYYTEADIAELRSNLDDRCYYCGMELDGGGEVDHMTPVVQGGDSWPSNLTLACRTCNRDKHAKTAEEFLQWRRERGLPIRRGLSKRN